MTPTPYAHPVGEAGEPRPPLTRSWWPAEVTSPLADLTVGAALRAAAQDSPGSVALVEGVPDAARRRRWTFAQLLEQAEAVARGLLARFGPGERVAVWADNLPEWVLLEYGAALAGITIVTVNPALRAEELRHVLRQSRAAGVFLVPGYRGSDLAGILAKVRPDLPGLREVVSFADWDRFLSAGRPDTPLPRVAPGSAAQVQYTSGTTGTPKGAVLHHRGIVNNARLYAERCRLTPGGVQVSPMPLFHTAGCVVSVLGALAVRGTLVLPSAFDPALMLHLVESERADTLIGVPTMLIGMLDHPEFTRTDVSGLTRVISGGAVVPPELVRRIETRTPAVVSVLFAQTEASPVITATSSEDGGQDRMETLGRPLPHTEVRIVDPSDGTTLPVGTVGELCTRGYHVMTGYFDDAVATMSAIDADGWLHTGDLASMDERGYCRIEGRLKEMIIRGGENIYPREIENVIFQHPDVADVAVVGVPDDTWGEQVAAFVRPAPGRTPDVAGLREYCLARLARHKVPKQWSVVEALPLTASGKVQKFRLRERLTGERTHRS
ncbi:AMP-binding protein [Streptosporangium amethystogenes subsp. fukuiense]|uniref:AMP-binding protein n=1 Tax=Streptosporangium amethystogenes subsp. fukuiense TaxID=698418 RepID=A0ABW2SS19_9ACTN